MSEKITLEQFQKVLPKSVRSNLTDIMVNNINNLLGDVQLSENYRENLLSYANVMGDGRYKLQNYINAVKYVSFKLLGSSNLGAYVKTFPDKYQEYINKKFSSSTIAALVSGFNKGQLVNKIMEQTLVPSYILNADLYQKALNTQAELMISANSEKVRTDAANSILTHLKVPETKKIEIDLGIKEDKTINDLRASTLELVEQQKTMLKLGAMNAKDIAHSKLLIEDGKVVDI